LDAGTVTSSRCEFKALEKTSVASIAHLPTPSVSRKGRQGTEKKETKTAVKMTKTLHGEEQIVGQRDLLVMKQFSLSEITSTVALPAVVVADLSRLFHAVDSAALQVTHRCTPAPCGMPAAPAVLPTHSFGDVDPCWIQIFGLHVRCRLAP